MICALVRRIRAARIEHHSRRAAIFGAAVLAAQCRRDWIGAGFFMERMHKAQAKRDALIERQNWPAVNPIPHALTWIGAVALVAGFWAAVYHLSTT